MFPCSFESFLEQLLEVRITRTIQSSHDIHILLLSLSATNARRERRKRESPHHKHLERCRLKSHISRRVTQHEPKVNMNQMPILVYEDVPVMPIFDLKKVCDDRVTCERTDKIALSTSESTRVWFTECLGSLSAGLQKEAAGKYGSR